MSLNTVSPVNNQNAYGIDNGLSATKSLGLNEFLLILTTELSNQNPLDPLNSRDFIAQTAQFASLNQFKGLNASLQNLSDLQQIMNNALTASLIGKEVKAQVSSINLKENTPISIGYDLESDVNNVKLEIYDKNGALVKTIEAGSQSKGQESIEWDGKDQNGINVSPGEYMYKIKGEIGEKGEEIEIPGFINGKVTGINFQYGQPYLVINDQSILLGNVMEIKESVSDENI